jgi:hypothetical protein
LYASFQSGELNLDQHFQQLREALPARAVHLLDWLGLSNLARIRTWEWRNEIRCLTTMSPV